MSESICSVFPDSLSYEMQHKRARTAAIALLETGLLVVPAVSFLRIYVQIDEQARAAPAPHLLLLATAWSAVLLVRLLVARLLPVRIGALIATATSSIVWLTLLAYYALATVGLQSWGKIITWPIIQPYLADLPGLLQYLELSEAEAILNTSAALLMAIVLWWRIAGPRDWVRRLDRVMPPRAFAAVTLGGAVALGIRAADIAGGPPTYLREPLSLSFAPPTPAQLGHAVWRRDLVQLARENSARSALAAEHPQRRPVVVLIVSDALRADRMGVFGALRDTTPNLRRRLAEAAAAPPIHAIAACAETSCAMPALLYSKPPRGMVTGALGLSEALNTLGYRSYILLSGDHTNYYGLSQIYRPADLYFDATFQHRRFVNDDRMVLDAVSRLPPPDVSHPTFIQIHLLSNHPLGMRWLGSTWYQPFENYGRWGKGNAHVHLTQKQKELARNYYDNGLRQMDAVADAALVELQRRGYLRDAFVVVTGDHGEMLGEHNMLSHAAGVYQPVLDVPALFLRYGYTAPALRSRAIAQIDIAPTILAELGVRPPSTWQGVPLQGEDPRDVLNFEQGDGAGLLVTRGSYRGHKYWLTLSSGRESVFDLSRDPGELRDITGSVPLAERRIWRRRVLDATLSTGAASSPTGTGAPDTGLHRPDPRDAVRKSEAGVPRGPFSLR